MLSPTYEITTALSHTDELISPPYDIAIVTISYGRVTMSSVWDSMMSKKNMGWPFYAAVQPQLISTLLTLCDWNTPLTDRFTHKRPVKCSIICYTFNCAFTQNIITREEKATFGWDIFEWTFLMFYQSFSFVVSRLVYYLQLIRTLEGIPVYDFDRFVHGYNWRKTYRHFIAISVTQLFSEIFLCIKSFYYVSRTSSRRSEESVSI